MDIEKVRIPFCDLFSTSVYYLKKVNYFISYVWWILSFVTNRCFINGWCFIKYFWSWFFFWTQLFSDQLQNFGDFSVCSTSLYLLPKLIKLILSKKWRKTHCSVVNKKLQITLAIKKLILTTWWKQNALVMFLYMKTYRNDTSKDFYFITTGTSKHPL